MLLLLFKNSLFVWFVDHDLVDCTDNCRTLFDIMFWHFSQFSFHWAQYRSRLSWVDQFRYPDRIRSAVNEINRKYFLKPGLQCTICDKSFRDPGQLEVHSKIHLNGKALFQGAVSPKKLEAGAEVTK